jgi:hypothetical protein
MEVVRRLTALLFPNTQDYEKPAKALRRPPSRASLMHRPVKAKCLSTDCQYPLPVIYTVEPEKTEALLRQRVRAVNKKRLKTEERVAFDEDLDTDDEEEVENRVVDPIEGDDGQDGSDSSDAGIAGEEEYSSSSSDEGEVDNEPGTARRNLLEPEVGFDVLSADDIGVEFYEEYYDLELFEDYLDYEVQAGVSAGKVIDMGDCHDAAMEGKMDAETNSIGLAGNSARIL